MTKGKYIILVLILAVIVSVLVLAHTNVIIPVPNGWQGFAWAGQNDNWQPYKLEDTLYIKLEHGDSGATRASKQIQHGSQKTISKIRFFADDDGGNRIYDFYVYNEEEEFKIVDDFLLRRENADKCGYDGCKECRRECMWEFDVDVSDYLTGVKVVEVSGSGHYPDYFGLFYYPLELKCENDEECGKDYCENWENYCYEEDVYKRRTCHDFYCECGSCNEDIYEEEVKVEDCGEDICGEWSENYCKDGDVYRKRMCGVNGCLEGECVSSVYLEEELVEECECGCSEGECLDCEIECYKDEDCGQDGCSGGGNYCCDNEVCQDFIRFTCHNPGTVESYCSSLIYPIILENCTKQGKICENGFCVEKPECEDTCQSLGKECGIWMICGEETICGLCDVGFECVNGKCVKEPVECENDKDCDDENICTNDICNLENVCEYNYNTKPCDDGFFCSVNDICFEGNCSGELRDCSIYNILPINTCNNNPDNNDFTFDFRNAFISSCDEVNDSCTLGNETITHTLTIGKCGVECIEDSDCEEDEECNNYKCEKEDDKDKKKLRINYCGDGYCDISIGEDEYTCPEDCEIEFQVLSYGTTEPEEEEGIVELKTKEVSNAWVWVLFLLILFVILLIIIVYLLRR